MMMMWRRIPVRRAVDLHRRLASTLVLAEHDGGALKAATLSAISAAKHLDESGKVSLLLAGCGSSLRAAAEQAASSHPSLTEVLIAESESLEHALAEPWAELIFSAQQKGGYSHVIAVSNSFGKNVLPRAAALFDVSPIADVIQILDDRTFVRPIYAGNALCKIHYKGEGPCLLTVRPTAFPATSGSSSVSKSPPAPISSFDVTGLRQVGSSTWIGQTCQQSERPELGTAKVVVAGGRALKNSENFQMLEILADKLGGAVGATRAAVDAGYVPNDLQVGQTGKVVAPELYLAIGISGAIQHLAGMKDSKVIVAINKDADAPIFKVADYGLVADLFQAIPELIEKLPESSTTNKNL